MSTSTIVKSYDSVCDAIKDVHDEQSLWHLSDELVKVAPNGVDSVTKVVEQAKVRGIPVKSVNTLRLYRDVAHRFPASERVPMVSFSAHREAIAVGDVKQARRVLEELVSKHGASGVTVTTVKQAIGAATGKVPTAPKSAAKVQSTYIDIAHDLNAGGKKFIAALDQMTAVNGVTLDGLHAGLTTVLTAVEARRSKAARQAASAKAKAPATPVNPAKSPAARKAIAQARNMGKGGKVTGKTPVKAAVKGKAGDLRDL